LAALSLSHPTGHACRRCAQRGWASHPAVTCSLTQLSMWFCKAHATPLPTSDDHGNSLSRKAHWQRGSVEGQPRTNMAVLMGSQLPVGWHVQLHIIARIAMTSRDRTVAERSGCCPRRSWDTASEGQPGARLCANGMAHCRHPVFSAGMVL